MFLLANFEMFFTYERFKDLGSTQMLKSCDAHYIFLIPDILLLEKYFQFPCSVICLIHISF